MLLNNVNSVFTFHIVCKGFPMTDDKYFSDVCQRLMAALNLSTETALAEELGFKPAAFSNRKKRGSLPNEEIDDLIQDRGLSHAWVYRGEMPMFAAGPKQDQLEQEFSEVMEQIKSMTLHNEMLLMLQPLIRGIVWRDKTAIESWVEDLGKLSASERQIIAAFRNGGPNVQAAMQLIAGASVGTKPGLQQTFKGDVGQVVQGSQAVNGGLKISQRKKL